jgi:putative flippase GtrA
MLSRQALRFVLVGIGCTALHVAIAGALIEIGGSDAGAANGIAFTIATLASYVSNSIWTFQAPLAGGSLARFVVVALAGLAITVAVTSAIQSAGYHYLVGIAAVVLTVPALSFLSHRLWTYRRRHPAGQSSGNAG